MERVDIRTINSDKINKDNFKPLLDDAQDCINYLEKEIEEDMSVNIYKFFAYPRVDKLQVIILQKLYLKYIREELPKEFHSLFAQGLINWDKRLNEYIK